MNEIIGKDEDTTSPARPAGLGDPILRWARDHLIWSAVALGLLLFIVKLLFVARGNISVALALLQVANPKSVFLGTLIANVPLFATLLFILSGAWLGMAIVSDSNPELVAIMAGLLLFISVMIMPAPVFGSVQHDAFSGALLAFGVSYIITQMLPIIAKWVYSTPEFAILTKGVKVYSPGSLMALKQAARPVIEQLQAQGVELPQEKPELPGQIFEELVDEYETAVPALAAKAGTASMTLAGMNSTRMEDLRAKRELLRDQRLRMVISETDAFIKNLDSDIEKTRRELRNAKLEDAGILAKLQELRDLAEQDRLELARRRPVVREAERFKVLQMSRLIAALALVVVALVAIANSEMWLPASQITVRASSVPVSPSVPGRFVGYVLADGGSWTTIMLDTNRSIVRVPTSSIVSEPICSPRGSVFEDSIYEVVFGGVAAARRSSPPCLSG